MKKGKLSKIAAIAMTFTMACGFSRKSDNGKC